MCVCVCVWGKDKVGELLSIARPATSVANYNKREKERRKVHLTLNDLSASLCAHLLASFVLNSFDQF